MAGKHRERFRTKPARATKAGAAPPSENQLGEHVDFIYNLVRGCNPAPGA